MDSFLTVSKLRINSVYKKPAYAKYLKNAKSKFVNLSIYLFIYFEAVHISLIFINVMPKLF